jgi:(2Fe-2S) ferredoxin
LWIGEQDHNHWYTLLIKRVMREIVSDCIARNVPVAEKSKEISDKLLEGSRLVGFLSK